MSRKSKTIYLSAMLIVFVVLLGVGVFFATSNKSVSNDKEANNLVDNGAVLEDISSDKANNLSDGNYLVEYEKYYDEWIGQIRESDPSSWDMNMVNKAYVCLLYSYRTKMYTSAEFVASMIEGARLAGVKVDNNSAKISKDRVIKIRDESKLKIEEDIKARVGDNANTAN